MKIGIEAINAYVGQTSLDIRMLFEARKLDLSRFNNLLMEQKSVPFPFEDPITNAVNAAKPLVDKLSEVERSKIDLIITGTESGLDFGKSLSTYIHKYLGISKKCRVYEIKQACFGGTAALQAAASSIVAQSPNSKALVIATDTPRAATKLTYFEPSQGVAGLAMIIGNNPEILEINQGSSGYYCFEVMDTCRPQPEIETGDPDVSLLSYLDCLEGAYQGYAEKVKDTDFVNSFDYFAFHTPFPGMVKGAHRKLMRQLKKVPPNIIEEDFQKRVMPSLVYCMKVGNVYSASLYLALCGLLDTITIDAPKRVGLFSYGSGCSSEFFSGIITPKSKEKLAQMKIGEAIAKRYPLTMEEYDKIIDASMEGFFGAENRTVDITPFQKIYDSHFANKGLLVLDQIKGFHREYRWS